MNRVLLTGRLTRDPEMRSLPSGKTVTNFSVATNEYRGGEERTEYHAIVTWERLAEICGQFLGKGQLVALEGRLQTRRWEDERKLKHYRTEIVASSLEMLSGRRKKDYAAETAAQALETQAEVMGLEPVGPEDYREAEPTVEDPDATEAEEAETVAA
ncbi:MAG: single-stranded DNA-binding protein [Chloroflexota bacterium]|jgi:single stranded DNA-binding protein